MADLVPEGVQRWAQGTLACGLGGVSFGALHGFLNGQHMLFFAAAYGTNTIVVSGAVLGLRAVALASLPPAMTDDKRWVTAAASSLVGGGMMTFMSGARRAPTGAALFGVLGAALQHCADEVNAWRAVEAGRMGVDVDTPTARGVAAEEDSILGPRTTWGWLPFAADHATADQRQLRKLKARLADIDDALGLVPREQLKDPRTREVEDLERRAQRL